MLYTLVLKDNPSAAEARDRHRDGHLAHFKANKSKIALSGPLKDDDGNAIGSLIIYEASGADEALSFIKADPFYDADVWNDVTIGAFKPSIFSAEKFGD